MLPFSFKRWLRILLIVWLTGQVAGFGGNGSVLNNLAKPRTSQAPQTQAVPNQNQSSPPVSVSTGAGTGQTSASADAVGSDAVANPDNPFAHLPHMTPLLIILFLVVWLALSLLFVAWLGARFNFIFIDLIVRRDIRIRESFRQYKQQGNSFFIWLLVFWLSIVGCAFLVGLIIYAVHAAWPAQILLLLLLDAAIALVTLVVDFVLPVMYRDGTEIREGLKKFLAGRLSVKGILLYLLVKIGLGFVAGVIAGIVGFLIIAVFFILALTLAIPGALLANAVAFLKPVLIVIGVILAVPAIFFMIVSIWFVLLPIPVFFRAFSLLYLMRFMPDYKLLSLDLDMGKDAAGPGPATA